MIPAEAFFDFESVEDAIELEYRQLEDTIESKRDLSDIHSLYEACRLRLSRQLMAAASTVSMSLIRNNVTATTHREAFKEYADLHQKALSFLIDRTNQLLGQYRQEFPGLGPAASSGSALVWPTEQMSILNEFVEMTRDLSWVHEGLTKGPSRDLIVVDYDQLELGLIQASMAMAYVVLAYAMPGFVHFTIASLGVNEASLTALVLTTSWPLYLARALGERHHRPHPAAFLSVSVIVRGLVLGGLMTSYILLQALAIHGLPLYTYLVLFVMSTVIIKIVAQSQYRLPSAIATIVVALMAMSLAMASSADVLLGGVTMVTAILPECHGQVKRRLFGSGRRSPEQQTAESDAVSSVFSFAALIVILSSNGEWAQIQAATRSISAASWPAFLAVCVFMALDAFLADYLAEQLEADGVLNLDVLKTVSYALPITFGIGLFQEPYTPVSMAAVVISMLALVIDAWPGLRPARSTDAKLALAKSIDNQA